MVRILKSESGKVTVEFSLAELSGVENDLDVYLNEPLGNEEADPATEAFRAEIAAFWTGIPPTRPDA